MKKLSMLGQNIDDLVDCSETIPIPPPLLPNTASARYLEGFNRLNITHSSRKREPFTSVTAQTGGLIHRSSAV